MNVDFVFNLEKLLKCKTDGIQKLIVSLNHLLHLGTSMQAFCWKRTHTWHWSIFQNISRYTVS